MKRYNCMSEYEKENAAFLNQPIIKSFLDREPDNIRLLELAFTTGDKKAMEELDRKFVEHFYFFRLLKYISSVSYYFSIDFDKNHRKQKDRFPLLLDHTDKSANTLIEFLSYKRGFSQDDVYSADLFILDVTGDENLNKVLSNLTKKERDILHLLIIEGMKQVDVAKIYGDTPQNIAKTKKKALERIRKEYKKGGN
ncbi:sigma-70 family RNA polymerase sigma factor [Bacillus sp. FJAT-27445]|uniref:sigma-70 family RNA polymerase sigma factor n=1 Tax=Bacillus sp. FJAT-27445 TaxID=1679166 RepID=UPI0007437F1C|nr:sigma-70 family RNA polymerase sigma factor [Bacillus sp. FJAT-27445]